jgi:hypothetical protein
LYAAAHAYIPVTLHAAHGRFKWEKKSTTLYRRIISQWLGRGTSKEQILDITADFRHTTPEANGTPKAMNP